MNQSSNQSSVIIILNAFILNVLVNAEYIYNSIGFLYNLKGMALGLIIILLIVSTIINFHKIRFNILCLTMLLFASYVVISYLYITPATLYGYTKTIGCVVAFILITYPLVTTYTMDDIRKFLYVYFVLDILLLIFVIFYNGAYDISQYSRLEIGEINPIWLARLVGEVAIMTYFILSKKWAVLKYVLMTILLIILLASGSKGPLIALLISIIAIDVFYSNKSVTLKYLLKTYFKSILVITSGIVFIRFVVLNFFDLEYIISRFSILDAESQYGELSRMNLISRAVDYFFENPLLGKGIGAFGVLTHGYDYRRYPHNIFIEALTELGLVGFLLILFSISIVFISFIKRVRLKKYTEDHNLTFRVLGALFIFYFINANVSGDLTYSNMKLFFFMGLLNYAFLAIKINTGRT